ncbi:MAG TPA: hypothetical protein VFB45_16205 [Pseudolabrys sp.]|nr:hypothetical protein [Pseudolabrys sp.]
MGRAIAAISIQAAALLPRPAIFAPSQAVEALRKMLRELFNPYHPERHYMRGPGPKWREKHGQIAIF